MVNELLLEQDHVRKDQVEETFREAIADYAYVRFKSHLGCRCNCYLTFGRYGLHKRECLINALLHEFVPEFRFFLNSNTAEKLWYHCAVGNLMKPTFSEIMYVHENVEKWLNSDLLDIDKRVKCLLKEECDK